MTTRELTVANLRASFDALIALCESLSDDEWQAPSLCPEWDVRGVLLHVAAVEHMLDGWFPETGDSPLPFDRIGAYAADTEALSGPELLDRFRTLAATRLEQLDALDDEAFAADSMTPVGRQSYGRFMEIRVFDVWVHVRDISIPLERATADGGPDAEMALAEVRGSMGYIAGKKIGMEDGSSLKVSLTGPVEGEICVAVDGRASVVPTLAEPTAELITDSTTFIMLACGRLDPAATIASGTVRWTGDEALGERAATSLTFTM